MDNPIMTIKIESEEHLISLLFGAVGLEVNSANIIFDQDTGAPLTFNRKYLSLGYGPKEFRCINFNITKSKKMAEYLTSYFAEKIRLNDGVYISVMGESYIKELSKNKIEIILINSEGKSVPMESGMFNNICFAYIDLILKLNDLHISIPEWMDNNDHLQRNAKGNNRKGRKAPKK